MEKDNQINRIKFIKLIKRLKRLKRLKKTVKTLWAGAVSISGAGEAYQRLRHVRSGKTCGVILTYHRVVPRSQLPKEALQDTIQATIQDTLQEALQVVSLPGIVVCEESFEAQMRLLAREFDPIALDEFVSALANRVPLPRKCVVVTFDDGWQDNYLFAFPILKSYAVPATVFLTTGYVGTTKKIFWQESLVFLIKSLQKRLYEIRRRSRGDTSGDKEKLLHFFSAKGLAYLFPQLEKAISGRDAVSELIEILKGVDKMQVNCLIEALDEYLGHPGFPYSQNSFLGWEQIREMSGSNVTFGSHSATHGLLTELDDDDLYRELSTSKTAIEDKLKFTVNTLAYPNGNFDNRVIRAAKDAGYTGAVSTIAGVNDGHTDPFALRRINIHEGKSTGPNGSFSSSLFSTYVAGLL
ncbi:MAG: polysaccharide deacetylase family protein [Nitrospirae bacterium]|nr:polysaccharide deacetylase family protein [Nitrospirota bacterium]